MTRKFRYLGKGHTMITDVKGNPLKVKENEIVESSLDIEFLLGNGFELIWAKDVKDLKVQLKTLIGEKKGLAWALELALEDIAKKHKAEIKEIKESFKMKGEELDEVEAILKPQIKQAKADSELAKKNIKEQMDGLQADLDDVDTDDDTEVVDLTALRAKGKELKIKGAHLMGEEKLLEKIAELTE